MLYRSNRFILRYSQSFFPPKLPTIVFQPPRELDLAWRCFFCRQKSTVLNTGSVFLRFPTPKTGVLPHGAPIKCLIGYYDSCEPILSNQAKRPYPSLVIEGRQDRVSRSIQDTTTDEFRHPPVIGGTPTRRSVLIFSSKKIFCLSNPIEAVTPHIMRAQTRVIDPHRVCFISPQRGCWLYLGVFA